jgi:hypothetical protein
MEVSPLGLINRPPAAEVPNSSEASAPEDNLPSLDTNDDESDERLLAESVQNINQDTPTSVECRTRYKAILEHLSESGAIAKYLQLLTRTNNQVFVPYNLWERFPGLSDEAPVRAIDMLIHEMAWFKLRWPTFKIILRDNTANLRWMATLVVAIAYFDATLRTIPREAYAKYAVK